MHKERIGFVGVGLMGHGMAKNIVTKGWPLTVMGHRNRQPVDNLLSLGATEAKTAREMAEQVDIVVLCVTGSSRTGHRRLLDLRPLGHHQPGGRAGPQGYYAGR